MTSSNHTNIEVKKTKDAVILIVDIISVRKENKSVNMVIDLGVTDYYFIDLIKFEKFENLLVGRTVKKEINFLITR